MNSWPALKRDFAYWLRCIFKKLIFLFTFGAIPLRRIINCTWGKNILKYLIAFYEWKNEKWKRKKRRVDEKSNNLDHVLYAEAFQPFPGFSFVNVWIMDERRRGKAKGSVIIAVFNHNRKAWKTGARNAELFIKTLLMIRWSRGALSGTPLSVWSKIRDNFNYFTVSHCSSGWWWRYKRSLKLQPRQSSIILKECVFSI